ncbi:ubiquinone biosynthesis O-methyltransferase-like isoform X1 [Ptychodera flava]|uniref:ubiquinone biosynthesis O-methyltransferase-like isoform X1 n=1 Tax=Ptychodera flava TaxID=63121 RepID=UPI00396A6614
MNQSRFVLEKYSEMRAATTVDNMKHITSMMKFDAGDNVLDLGCGPGRLTKLISSQAKSVTGIDKSPGMIDVAKRYQSADNITYVVADACDFDILEKYRQTFDKVVVCYVLHWNVNIEPLLKRTHQYLKPGGQCYLNTHVTCSGFDRDTIATIAAYTKEPKWARYMEGYEYPYYPYQGSCDDFKEDLRKAGFKNMECKIDVKELLTDDEDIAKARYRNFMDHANRVPEELREEYLEDAFNFVAEKSRTEGREYAFSTKNFSAVACK